MMITVKPGCPTRKRVDFTNIDAAELDYTRIWVILLCGVNMPACTFFGHHDCPSSIRLKLREVLIDLIENQSVDMFYVGNHGAFDRLVCSILRELVEKYLQIRYAVLLERMPGKQNEDYPEDFSEAMLPESIEEVSSRFAIVWRNKWMLKQSNFVVTYITHSWGGAYSLRKWPCVRRKPLSISHSLLYVVPIRDNNKATQ